MWFLRKLKAAQTTGEKIVLDGAVALFVALFVGFVLASLSAAGIITMALAVLLLMFAWVVAMIGTFLMTHLWNPSHKHRALFGAVLAVFLVMIGILEYKYQPAEAQPAPTVPSTPSYTQACQPGAGCSQGQTGGQTIGTLNQYGAIHRPNGLYQNGQMIGLSQDSVVDEVLGAVTLQNPRISGGAIDFDSPFEFRAKNSQDYLITCPSLRPMHPEAASVSIAVAGNVKCNFVKK